MGGLKAATSPLCPCGASSQLTSNLHTEASSIRRPRIALCWQNPTRSLRRTLQGLPFPGILHHTKVLHKSQPMLRLRTNEGRVLDRMITGEPPCALADTQGPVVKEVASKDVLRIWQSAEAVCFDVDSTVCVDEGIDELAAFCGAGDAVAEWTRRAMGGGVPFEKALAARLGLIKPSVNDLESFLAAHPPRLSPGIAELVECLQRRGVAVYLVSGGFRQMIEPVAQLLNIPKDHIYANRLLFDDKGEHAGFDPEEFTAWSGGKAKAVGEIKKQNGFSTVVAIGDGATDLEARGPGGADAFIGYGGIVVRPSVAAAADWFVKDFQTLIRALEDAK